MWYTSAINYDLVSTNPWNSMNLHMNQLWARNDSMKYLFNVPQLDFGNFTPYPNYISNSYLTNPFYTMQQMTWGTPAWNNMPWGNGNGTNNSNPWNMNMMNPWNMNMMNPWNVNSGNNSGAGNNDSNDNNVANRKYNKLLSLVKQLVKYDCLTQTQKDKLNEAINNTKGTAEEKYERLLKAYKEIDKNTRKDFLIANATSLGTSKNINGNSDDKDTIYNRLEDAGFEYSNSKADSILTNVYDGIKTFSDSDASGGNANDVSHIGSNIDVLDFISSWNNRFDTGFIEHFNKNYGKISQPQMREDARDKVLKPVVEALTAKAEKVAESLDETSADIIKLKIEAVQKALDDNNFTTLAKEFNQLYLYTRQGAMCRFRNDLQAYYGELDSELFNDELFVDEVTKDLKDEAKKTKCFTENDVDEVSFLSVNEKLAQRVSDAGNDDEPENDTVDGAEDDAGKTSEQKKAEAKKAEAKKAEARKKLEEVTEGAENKNSESYDAKYAGKQVAKDLEASTGISEVKRIANYLNTEKLTKDNIYDFLDAYYTETDYDKEGLIEFLDDDCDDHTEGTETINDKEVPKLIVTISMKKNIIESLIAKAKEMNLENEESYKSLTSIYNEWKDSYPDATNFNQTQSNKHYWINWLGGLWTNYNEALDKEMVNLFKAMKDKIQGQKK